MFTIEQRDHVRQRVLEMAQADARVIGGALTGSTAFGAGDAWSDIDVAFGISDGSSLEAVLDDWMQILQQEFGVLDHFDLLSGTSIYRVFLLSCGLEVDVAVTPASDYGARGPNFKLLFGRAHHTEASPQPIPEPPIGLCWHHVYHIRSCIERGKPWQAEYWLSELRDIIVSLMCMRLGENPIHGRGVDRLPASVSDPLLGTLVSSLDAVELRRALAVATRCLIGELTAWKPALSARLEPHLQEIGLTQSQLS